MKKFLSIFIALAMVLSLFAGVGARTAKAAAGAATVTVGSATLSALGSQGVDVTATIPAGANIGSMQFTLTYDGTKISIPAAGVTAGALTSTFVANNPTVNTLMVGGLAPNLTTGVVGPTVVLAHVTVTALAGLTAGTSTPITLSATTLADSAVVSYAVTPVNGAMDVTLVVPPVRTLTGIAITPNPANILINTAQQFVVTGTYNVAPLTDTITASSAVWSTNAPNGYFVGMTLGQFAVTASYGGFNSFAVVNVTAVPVTTTTTTTTTGTLGITTTGTFVGGVDGSGALGVNGVGTVVSGAGTSYVVNVTTAAVGVLDTANGIQVLHNTGVTSVDTDWATTGIQTITLGTLPLTGILNVGDTIKVAGTSTNGSGKILGIDLAGTHAVVNVTTAAVGVIGPQIYKTSSLAPATIDVDWMTVGLTQSITLDAAATLVPGDKLTVYMLQAVPATAATAFFMVTGVPVKGDVATITWQDTLAASHTVSYTTVAGDTSNSVALALSQLVDALDVTTGNVFVANTPITGSVVQLTQDVGGVAGNGKTLTGTTTAAVVPTLIISTLGGLTQPAYVEQGKTIKLVAKDATGAVVSVTWTSSAIVNATVDTTGLVTAASVASNLTGVTVITATSGTATGVFAVVVIPVQVITSLKINLVPAVPVSTTSQQFGAIASNATYSALDYTTQVVWTDALAVASIKATTGLLTYSTDEIGNVYAAAGGITATANVKIATGVVTLAPVVGPVTKVIVLTIGSDIVTVDGKATTVDAAPEITNGRTFVPIRFIAETFGSTVTWLPETKGVTIVLGDTTIGLQIGNATAVINGTIIALDAAPYIKNSRTMVPLRVISESFGGNVAWDPINHIITITYVLPVVPVVPVVPAA